jgi:hypothetical protein
MRRIPYSPAKADLFHPARRGEFFQNGAPAGEVALCAELCRLAYSRPEPAFHLDQPMITAALGRIGFTATCFDSNSADDGRGTHAILAQRDDPAAGTPLTVIAFRGTDADDHIDIVDDADVMQVDWQRGGRVHRGFARALDGLLENLQEALGAVSGRVLFTGHSLGAAMATLLASVHHPDALYTFGSPRVGDTDFVATLAGVQGRRFVDCCDVVTRVPPVVFGRHDYVHYGDPHYIDRNGTVLMSPGDGEMEADRLRAATQYLLDYAWRSGNVGVRELADHTPINYLYAVAADSSQP